MNSSVFLRFFSSLLNSDISDGDIQFIMRTTGRGNIQFTVLIEGADAFILDDSFDQVC